MNREKYQPFITSVGMLGIARLLVALRGLILLPLLTKVLGVDQYGMWAQFSITLTLLAPVIALGFPDALVRFLPGEQHRENIRHKTWSVFSIVLLFSLLIILVSFLLSESIGNFLQLTPTLIVLLSIMILFESLLLVLTNVFRALQKMRLYTLFTFLLPATELMFIGSAILFGYDFLGVIFSLLFAKILVFIVALLLVMRIVGLLIPTFTHLNEYIRFGFPIVVGSAAFWAVQSSDRYLIGSFLGITAVGYYAPAYTLGNILHFFIMPLALALPPLLSKLFEEKHIADVKSYLSHSLTYFLLIAIPSVFGLSVLSKQLLSLFSTNEIADASFTVLPFVAVSLLLYGVYTISYQVLFLFKKTGTAGYIWIAAAFLNIGLNILFIPIFGILGAAITTLISYIFAVTATQYYAFHSLSFPIDWQIIRKVLLASLLMTAGILVMSPTGTFQTLGTILAGIVMYIALLLLFRVLTKKELGAMRYYLISSFKKTV